MTHRHRQQMWAQWFRKKKKKKTLKSKCIIKLVTSYKLVLHSPRSPFFNKVQISFSDFENMSESNGCWVTSKQKVANLSITSKKCFSREKSFWWPFVYRSAWWRVREIRQNKGMESRSALSWSHAEDSVQRWRRFSC